jgi:hypothetical protein
LGGRRGDALAIRDERRDDILARCSDILAIGDEWRIDVLERRSDILPRRGDEWRVVLARAARQRSTSDAVVHCCAPLGFISL